MKAEKIKPTLHVNGNIIAERMELDPTNGGGITCYVSTQCVDLSEAIVIEGDLHVHSLAVSGQEITCSGEFVCLSLSPSEEASQWV